MSRRPNIPSDIFKFTKPNVVSGCLEWTGSFWKTGYGRYQLMNRSLKAHRLAFELANGPIPDGMCVLHRCDNRKCVNAEHLFLGTRSDNNLDKTNKDRQTKGEDVNTAKLTAEQAIAIRRDARRSKDIAADYGITWGHVNKIKRQEAWKHG